MAAMLYSAWSTRSRDVPRFPSVIDLALARPAPDRHAGHAPVPRRQAAASRRDRLLPHGRLLRDVLRGRADGVARPRADADLARQGRVGRRHPDVRAAVSRRGRLPRAPGAEGLPRRHLRSGRGPAQGQGPRQARGHARASRPARSPTPSYLEAREPAFLAALAPPRAGAAWGLAFLDVSTGEFAAAEFGGADAADALAAELALAPPSRGAGSGRRCNVDAHARRPPRRRGHARGAVDVRARARPRGAVRAAPHDLARRPRAGAAPAAVSAAGALVAYLRDTQRGEISHVHDIALRVAADALLIDPVTVAPPERRRGRRGRPLRVAARRARSHVDADGRRACCGSGCSAHS